MDKHEKSYAFHRSTCQWESGTEHQVDDTVELFDSLILTPQKVVWLYNHYKTQIVSLVWLELPDLIGDIVEPD
jgi:hypothetical protein